VLATRSLNGVRFHQRAEPLAGGFQKGWRKHQKAGKAGENVKMKHLTLMTYFYFLTAIQAAKSVISIRMTGALKFSKFSLRMGKETRCEKNEKNLVVNDMIYSFVGTISALKI